LGLSRDPYLFVLVQALLAGSRAQLPSETLARVEEHLYLHRPKTLVSRPYINRTLADDLPGPAGFMKREHCSIGAGSGANGGLPPHSGETIDDVEQGTPELQHSRAVTCSVGARTPLAPQTLFVMLSILSSRRAAVPVSPFMR